MKLKRPDSTMGQFNVTYPTSESWHDFTLPTHDPMMGKLYASCNSRKTSSCATMLWRDFTRLSNYAQSKERPSRL